MSNLIRTAHSELVELRDFVIILFAAVVTTLAALILAISQVFTKGDRR